MPAAPNDIPENTLTRRRLPSRLGRFFVGLVLLFIVLAGVLAIYVTSPTGRTRLARVALGMVPLTEGYSLDFASSGGRLPSRLVLNGLKLSGPDGATLLNIDTARVGVRILPLLRRRVQLTHVDAAGAAVNMHQESTGTWDLIRAFPVDTTSSGLSIRIGEATVSGLTVYAAYNTPTGDSVFVAGPAFVRAHDIQMVDRYGARVDTLFLPFTPAGLKSSATLAASVSFFDSQLQVRSARLFSERSDVDVRGNLAFDDQRAQLLANASPLSFADVAPFLPGIDPSASARGSLTVQRDSASVNGQWVGEGAFDLAQHGSIKFAGSWFGIQPGLWATASNPPTDSGASLGLSVQADHLNPAVFGTAFGDRASVQRDQLTGNLTAELTGDNARHLSGSVEFDFTETTLPKFDVDRPRGRATLVQGEVSFSAAARFAGKPITLRGSATPFDELPRYDVTADVRGLDASRIGRDSSMPETALTGSIRITGAGFASPDLTIVPALSTSRVGNLEIATASGSATYANNSIAGSLQATTAEGGARLRGTYHTATTEWRVAEAAFSNVDILAVTGAAGTSSLYGTVGGSGRGLAEGTVEVIADTLIMSAVRATRTRLTARILNETVAFDHAGVVNGAPVRANGTYVLASQGGRHQLTLHSGRVDSLDVATLPGMAEQTGSVTARVSGAVTFATPTSADGTVTLELEPSTFNRASIAAGTAELELDDGAMRFQIAVDGAGGSIEGRGTARPFVTPSSYRLDELRFDRIDAGAVAGIQGVSTSLAGTLSAAYDTALVARVELRDSRINQQTGISGVAQAQNVDTALSVSWAVSWRAPNELEGERPGSTGRLTLTPETIEGQAPTLEGTARVSRLNVADWWPTDANDSTPFDTTKSDLSFAIRYDGNLATAHELVGRLEVDSLAGTIGASAITDGQARIGASNGLLDVEQLNLETAAGLIEGRGPLAVYSETGESDFYLDINARDLSLIGDLLPRTKKLGGLGSISAAVVGPSSATTVSVDGTFGSITYGQNRSASAELFAEATLDANRELATVEGRFRIVNLIVGTAGFRDTRLQVTTVDSTIQFQGQSEIDSRRNLSISGTVDPRPGVQSITILGANVRLDNDRWSLLQASTLTYGDAFRIRNLLLYTDDQQIAVDGVVDLDGDQSLILTIENFRIGSVADLLGYRGLDGTMNGYLDLVGPSVAPIMQGDLNVDLESNKRPVGDLQLALAYDSLRLRLDGLLNHAGGGTMEFVGLLPVDLRLAATRGPTQSGVRVSAQQALPDSDVDLTMKADSFSIGWILPFLDPAVYSQLDGVVNGTMNMRGTFAEPLMTGSATVTNGTVGLPLFGIEVRRLRGDLLFEDRNILINNMLGESGRGSVRALGSIELTNLSLGQFDISFDLEDFLAVDNSDYRAVTAGDLLLYGTTRKPVVSGYLRLQSLDLFYKGALEEFEPVTLTPADLRAVELVFGRRVSASDTTTYNFYTALEIDINLEMTRDSWMRSYQNPRMDVPFYGSLDVAKQSGGEMEAFGTIDIVQDRGRIVELGRKFDVNRGTITFNGPLDNPRVDLTAGYFVKSRGAGGESSEDITITLSATGTLQDLDLTLASDPAMETTDILSYLLVGRPARESLQFGGGEESLAAGIALGQAAGFLEGLAGEELGLDVVRIEYEGTEVKLTAGKYLRSGVYVAISQPIVLNSGATQTEGSGERQLLLEVEILKGLLARAQQQGTVFGLNLFWQYAY